MPAVSENVATLDLLRSRERQWPLIARDIVMLMHPVAGASQYSASDLAALYSLTEEQFAALLNLKQFQELVKQTAADARQLGPRAGVRMRAETMALSLQEKLYLRAMSGELEDKNAMQLLGMLLKSAGIEQPPEQAAASAAKNMVNIAFNLPHLSNRKLAHLMNQPQTRVVEMTAE